MTKAINTMRAATFLLVISLVLMTPAFADSLKFTKVEFDVTGVPSKISFVYYAGSLNMVDYPSVAVFDGVVLHIKGDEPKVLGKEDDHFKVEFTIDVKSYPDLLRRFDKSDWKLSMGGKLEPEKIAGAQFVRLLTIRDVNIGIVLPKTDPAGADQPAPKPADKSSVKDQPSTPTSKDRPASVMIKATFIECGSRTDEVDFDWILPFRSTTAEGADDKLPEAPQPPR